MSVTAKEIARILNLSEAAVSLALNNRPGVSTNTRTRVWETAKQMGYDFSRKASHSTDIKGNICLVLYKKSGAVLADTPFFSALTEGVLAGCKRGGYDLVIRELYEDDNLPTQLYQLKNSSFSGLILLATEMDLASIRRFYPINLPIVILDAYYDALPYDCILINNTQGAYLATDYLIRHCKKQPGYLHSSYHISNFDARSDGFYRAVRSHGFSTSKCIVHHLSPSQDGAYADMKALLASGESPAACYFADNDLIAIGAIRALREFGFRIPVDISIIGFDNLPQCESHLPSLSTVRVPIRPMGEIAAQHIIQRIENPKLIPLKIEVTTNLIKRKSVNT